MRRFLRFFSGSKSLFERKAVFGDCRGFTLIEILVVIAITLILSAMVLAYSRPSLGQLVLYREQASVVGVLNEAKADAIQKANINPGNSNFDLTKFGLTACAFGIHFEAPATYILYQAVTSSLVCSPSVNLAYDSSNAAATIQTFTLDPSIKFNLSGNLDIAFAAPNLNVFATYGLPATIPLVATNGSRASIQVGQGGQIVAQ